jgi:sugar phosphate permease
MSTAPAGSTPAASPDAAPDAAKGKTSGYAWVVLGVLTLIYTFNFLDRQLLANLTENIKADTGLTDADLGKLGGIYFAAFYTILGVAVGFLADKGNRLRILAAGSFLWSLFTVLFGVAKGLPMMAASRMGVGVGEAAGAPPSYSILSDYFPAERRGMALAIFSLGVPFGTALGAGAGLMLANIDTHYVLPVFNFDIYRSWRFPFVLIGLLGIVATVLMLVIVREPTRGAKDTGVASAMSAGHGENATGFLGTAWSFFSRPMLVLTALACGSSAFVGYAVLNWTTPMLARIKDAPVRETSFILTYAFEMAICMGVGTWLSGVLADWLTKRSRVWYALVPVIALTIAAPFYVAFVAAPSWQMALVFLAVPTMLNNTYLAPALALVQNSVKPSQRTMSGALLLMVLNLIGLGLGPTFIGEMSTRMTVANVVSDLGVSAEQALMYVRMKAADLALLTDIAPTVVAAGKSGLQTALFWLAPFYGVALTFLLLEAMMIGREVKAGRAITDGGRLFGGFLVVAAFGMAALISATWVGGTSDTMMAAITDTSNKMFLDAALQALLMVIAAVALIVGATILAKSMGKPKAA